ncbi:3-oxoacyl-[acyl-carrier-protein] synthase-3 [Amycolatopsis bartoniae]|uniref:3-oxoacyl-ACP synthase n=1 Tax=Amycolatopsis bartoniae TaxID=941986 RepID=A0A8H9J126_9PSEU|nr:hypothetical protein [Amycolatopsis bartoniae]MBB2938624.1 3-oxoacyl-[acyl-carrier-protein] synthase-3 [Amycolatopsis bartoniae]GHF69666.1 hypothetical protein GCM10017566_49200 [Amycolatopsis bartoniae]
MRVEGRLRIAAAHAVVPERRQPVTAALERGVVTPAQARESSVDSLPVAERGDTAESLALDAARAALARSGVPAKDVALLVHSWMAETPSDWKLAPRLARSLGATEAVAFGVRQMCNGGAMGLQLAVSQLLLEPRMTGALVLTSDALGEQSVRRWQLGEAGAPLGDAATALVLSRDRGPFSVRGIASRSCTEQELTFPELNPILAGPSAAEAGASGAFSGELVFRLRKRVRQAVQDVCADADLRPKDPRLRTVLLPRVDAKLANMLTDGVLPLDRSTEVVHLAGKTGHLFAGDLAANLADLWTDRPAPGEYALVVNIGGGFTATCLLVRVEDEDRDER